MKRLGLILLITAALAPSGASADVDFLVPGVSLRTVDLTPGTMVSYLVISEAHGIRDSSLVSLKVTAAGGTGAGLEITSAAWPPGGDETVTVRLTLCEDASEFEDPADLYSCVSDVLVKSGADPFREPTREEIEDFDIGRLFLRRNEGLERKRLPAETVTVPAGTFECSVVEFSRSETRDVEMGGITAKRSESELSVLRTSDQIPFWGLVRSRVERTSGTSYPGGRRPRETRPKTTVTESVLLEYLAP